MFSSALFLHQATATMCVMKDGQAVKAAERDQVLANTTNVKWLLRGFLNYSIDEQRAQRYTESQLMQWLSQKTNVPLFSQAYQFILSHIQQVEDSAYTGCKLSHTQCFIPCCDLQEFKFYFVLSNGEKHKFNQFIISKHPDQDQKYYQRARLYPRPNYFPDSDPIPCIKDIFDQSTLDAISIWPHIREQAYYSTTDTVLLNQSVIQPLFIGQKSKGVEPSDNRLPTLSQTGGKSTFSRGKAKDVPQGEPLKLPIIAAKPQQQLAMLLGNDMDKNYLRYTVINPKVQSQRPMALSTFFVTYHETGERNVREHYIRRRPLIKPNLK